MFQRATDRDAPLRAPGERRVGLFIDYENIRRSLDEAGAGESLDLAQRARDLSLEQGRLLVAAAYADWSLARAAARDFRRCQIEPRMVLGREPDDDRSDLVMSLDVQEVLFLGPDLDVFVIVSGDAAFQELIQRLRRCDKTVVYVGFDSAAAPQLRGADRFVPLEDLAGLRRARRAPGPRRPDVAGFDWAPFVRLLDELEQSMPFVGFGWLLKKKLNAENSGCATLPERQEMMDRAVDDGILTLYKVDNIEEGGDPVTACKLNREHDVVRQLVGGGA